MKIGSYCIRRSTSKVLNWALEECQLNAVLESGQSIPTPVVSSRGKAFGRFMLSELLKHTTPDFLLQSQLLLLFSAGNVTRISTSEEHVKRGIRQIREKIFIPKY